MKGWSEEHVAELKRLGKIRDYKVSNPRPRTKKPNGKIVGKYFKKRSKEKDWIAWNLWTWCREKGIILKEEYIFDVGGRKWRFDHCLESLKVGIEYNGIMSEKSRHTSIKGYSGDMEKINAASKQGWTILQYTPLNYKTLIKDLDEIWGKLNKDA